MTAQTPDPAGHAVCRCGHKKNLHAGTDATGRCVKRSCGCGRYIAAESLWPCCRHCIDGDGMLPCGEVHDEPCGGCSWGDAELARWRKGLRL